LSVLLSDDLPLHDLLRRTNVVNYLRHTTTFRNDPDDDEVRRKIFKFDLQPKADRIKKLTKTYSSNSSLFIDKVEQMIVDNVRLGKTSTPSFDPELLECVATSRILFQFVVKVFNRYLAETEFEPRVVDLYRNIIREIHATSEAPIELYPPELIKLSGLILLHEQTSDGTIIPLIKSELLEVIKTQPIFGKVMIVLYPDIFQIDFKSFLRNSEFTSLSSYITFSQSFK
jgi:hypothetical protein